MRSHANAASSLEQRERMVGRVIELGWSPIVQPLAAMEGRSSTPVEDRAPSAGS